MPSYLNHLKGSACFCGEPAAVLLAGGSYCQQHGFSELVADHYGFVTAEELQAVAVELPCFLLLVRCGGFRFLATAEDVSVLVSMVSAGGDYVRDVSRPAAGVSTACLPVVETGADVRAWSPRNQVDNLADCLRQAGVEGVEVRR